MFSLRLGAILTLAMVGGVSWASRAHWPPWAMKAVVLGPALVWAVHVTAVVLGNRALDRGSAGGRMAGPR